MRVSALLEFFEPSIGVDWNLQPTQAFEYLRAKGLRATFSYADMLGEEHAAAFTVAKMLDTDLLADVKASLEDALSTGKSYRQWADELVPLLQSKGWWGRAPVVDPLTGQTVVAQLGSPSRLQTIFRTNMQSAYSVGHWEQIVEQQDEAPFLMYDAIDDYRTRPEHAALDGKIHAVGSAFWEHYYPPNGWGCRCSAIQLSADELDELGLQPSGPFRLQTREWKNPRTGKIERVADGVDPGFDFNPGQKRLDALSNLAIEKVKALPPDTRPAAQQKLDAPEPPIALAPRRRKNADPTVNVWRKIAGGAEEKSKEKLSSLGVGIDVHDHIAKRLEELGVRFDIGRASKSFDYTKSLTSEFDGFTSRLRFSTSGLSNLESAQTIDIAGADSGFFVRGGIDGLIDHEFGHAIDQYIKQSLAEELLDEWLDKKKALLSSLGTASEYAKKNLSEWLAERFSFEYQLLQTSGEVGPLIRAMDEYIAAVKKQ